MDNKTVQTEQAEINEIAKSCFFANNKAERNRCFQILYIKVFGENGASGKSMFYASLKKKASGYGQSNDKIFELFADLSLKYDYNKNSNFCSYIQQGFTFALNDIVKSNYRHITKKDENGNTVKDEKGNAVKEKIVKNTDPYDNDGNSVFDCIEDTAVDIEKEIEKKETMRRVRNSLVTSMLGFWEHNKGKKANPNRLSYFRIFFTEEIITEVMESKNTCVFNTAEVYENTDKALVGFVSDTEYNCIEDLLKIEFKNFSDVMEDYDKQDKKIFLPFDNSIILEYRYSSGLDQTRKTGANVSDQRKKYTDYLRQFFDDTY